MAIVNYDFLLFLLTCYDFSVHTKKRFVIALNKRTFTNTVTIITLLSLVYVIRFNRPTG
jgi:hypothetical protein